METIGLPSPTGSTTHCRSPASSSIGHDDNLRRPRPRPPCHHLQPPAVTSSTAGDDHDDRRPSPAVTIETRKQKMAQFYGLNDEILSFILTFLVTSTNGATDLARLSATCHKFLNLSRNSKVLKVVNFEKIPIDDYGAHRHGKDLLCLCARAGNPAAESMLGKALVHNDGFFWRMILEYDIPLLVQNALASGLLRHQKLVRRFIRVASDVDIAEMRVPLFCYIISVLGYDLASFSGILLAISNMCCYYLEDEDLVNYVHMRPLFGVNRALAWLTPPSGEAHRARVLELYDQMVPGLE